jgi:predicted amidophosphoribosyltransferase
VAEIRPRKIPGRWREGYALDFHTIRSEYIGDDEYGHPQFHNTRSEVGELLYRLKYRSDRSAVAELVEATASFVESWKPGADVIVPVPPSRARDMQPVTILGDALGKRLSLPFAVGCVEKARENPEIKNIYDYDERMRLLAGAYTVDRTTAQGRKILLFDDLYRSGATMNAVTAALYDQGAALDVFAITVTRTRSNP